MAYHACVSSKSKNGGDLKRQISKMLAFIVIGFKNLYKCPYTRRSIGMPEFFWRTVFFLFEDPVKI